ncbi:uncharacterized protein LOC135628623 isoform X1 [Musa acuminata AAA Group]|uniref:uncharacterized protein LOC135628623 isoform X1 n=1 Tax=Musa acuminata AAA Group TaxID=214697 RepID=UPI0031D831FB
MAPSSTSYPPLSSASTERVPQCPCPRGSISWYCYCLQHTDGDAIPPDESLLAKVKNRREALEPRCLGPRHRQRREGRRQTGTVWSPSSTRGVGSEAEEEEELPACLLSLSQPHPGQQAWDAEPGQLPIIKQWSAISFPPHLGPRAPALDPPHSPEGWADLSLLFPLALLMRPFPCCFFSFPPNPPPLVISLILDFSLVLLHWHMKSFTSMFV